MTTPSSPDTPVSLLRRLRDPGDAEAWETFVDLYGPLLYAYGRGKGLQEGEAADLTQEVLVEAVRCLPSFHDRPRGTFRDWLGALTRRCLARFLEAQGRRLADQADPEWTTAFHRAVLNAALHRIRPHFEPTTWKAFECTWLEDRPVVETAAKLGIPLEAVYVARARVLRTLREAVLELSENLPQGEGGG